MAPGGEQRFGLFNKVPCQFSYNEGLQIKKQAGLKIVLSGFDDAKACSKVGKCWSLSQLAQTKVVVAIISAGASYQVERPSPKLVVLSLRQKYLRRMNLVCCRNS